MGFRGSITLAGVEPFPLRASGGVSPRMALGTMPARPALLIRIADSDGCFGWGEIWANFPPRANLHKAHLVEDIVAPKLAGLVFTEPREAGEQLREALSIYFLHAGQSQVWEHVLAGIDTALWDLALRKAGRSFADHMGLPDRAPRCYASSINAEDLDRLIPCHAALGQTYFKLKVGLLPDGETDLINHAVELLPGNAQLLIDSNQSWDLAKAADLLGSLGHLPIFFAEEPLPADSPLSDWEELSLSTGIRLAAGENVYGMDRFLALANSGLNVLQPDVAKWGGPTGALDLAAAIPDGAILWPHFMGTAVGQMAALAVTAAVNGYSFCEMDVNDNALRTSLCGDVLEIGNGRVALPDAPGLVVPPAEAELKKFLEETR